MPTLFITFEIGFTYYRFGRLRVAEFSDGDVYTSYMPEDMNYGRPWDDVNRDLWMTDEVRSA